MGIRSLCMTFLCMTIPSETGQIVILIDLPGGMGGLTVAYAR